MRLPAILPLPDGLQPMLDARPRAFYAGCAAARDGAAADANPYTDAGQRLAWASGWLSVREGWVEALDHGVRAP